MLELMTAFEPILIILAFFILGLGVKLIDAAFDEKAFSPNKALVLALFVGLLWGYTMSLNAAAATILGAIILAVFFSGKINNIAFWLGTFTVISLLFWLEVFNFLWLPLIGLTISGIIDEKGHDFIEKKKANKYVKFFFEERLTMKLGALFFTLIGSFHWIYLIAFLAWDSGYTISQKIIVRKLKELK